MTTRHRLLRATGLTKAFGARQLWRDLSIAVHAGEMVAVTGPSGSGKSTLLNCIGLLEPLTAGVIHVEDREITRLRPRGRRRYRKRTLGMLFQNYALIDNAPVRFNLTIAMPKGCRRAAAADRIGAALDHVGMPGREDDIVYQLSGGEQQRVALARLIVKDPTLILADEPTGALDAENADMVIGALRQFAASGKAVLIATHSPRVTHACDRVVDLAEASTTPVLS